MIRAGLVSNARSQQNKKGLSALSAAAKRAGMVHRKLSGMDELGAILADFARQDIGLVVVNGGDGTVQAVLTELLERRPFEPLPPVALLPRGMTNMTAADVGLRGRPERAIRRLARLLEDGDLAPHLIRRRVLRLENVPGYPVQCGMFFGAGGIVQAIDYCHSRIHTLRIEANWAAGLTLLGLLAGWVLGGDRNRVITGHRITGSFDGGPEATDQRLLVLATTLERLVLHSRPFWNQGEGAIPYTAISYPPKRLLRSALRVLYGGQRRDLPAADYASRGADRVGLQMDCPFTLDGQMFAPPADAPLVITAPETVDFVRC